MMVLSSIRNVLHCSSRKISSEVRYKQRVFSGIQPTGAVHLGNYLGAIRQWVRLQESNDDMMVSIVDLHSITLPQDPKKLSRNILEMASTLLACGLDPKRTVLFKQSHVPQHAELCWHLSCVCTMARLSHLPQFREKSANLKDVPLGLYIYPVLQAADILLYKSTDVPVGEDQVTHLELTQDLARMFNNRFGDTFPLPRTMVLDGATARLRSLREPTKKMSKSDADSKSRICLTDSDDHIVRSCKKAVSDLISEVTYDPETRPGVSNLVTIHSELTGLSVEQVVAEAKKLNVGQYKLKVAEAVIEHVRPIRSRIDECMAEPQYVLQVLEEGGNRAREMAERTMREVRAKVGMDFAAAGKRRVESATS